VKSRFKLFAKYWVRRLLSATSRFEEGEKPHILLFANRRGGSTLLRDMIYSQPKFNYIDQPFDITHRQYNPFKHLFPKMESSQLISLSNDDESDINNYVNKLLTGNIILRSQWKIWESGYNFSYDRCVVKIVCAKALINWFQNNLENVQVVYLTRHPIPTSLSVMKLGWELSNSAYLNNKAFSQKYLYPETFEFAVRIDETGSLLEKFVLNWCLENLVPLQNWNEANWIKVSYEHIVSSPERSVKYICDKLDLSEPQRMLNTISIPTRTSSPQLRNSLNVLSNHNRISKWMDRIDDVTMNKIQKIFDVFNIDLYNTKSPLPLDSYFWD